MMLVIPQRGWSPHPAGAEMIEAFEELYVMPLKFLEETEFLLQGMGLPSPGKVLSPHSNLGTLAGSGVSCCCFCL